MNKAFFSEVQRTKSSAGVWGVSIPHQLNELEQEIHATKLATLQILRIASMDTILIEDASSLFEMCLKEPYPQNHNMTIATDGAQQSAHLIAELISQGRERFREF